MENEGGEQNPRNTRLQFLLTRALFRKPNDWEHPEPCVHADQLLQIGLIKYYYS